MAFHPEQIEAELRGRGVGAEEAHFAVMRQFGNSPRIKEPQPRRDALLAGDRDVGRAFFSAADGAKSRFCRDGDADAGARNRREYDDLRICGRGAGPALAVRAAEPAGGRGEERDGYSRGRISRGRQQHIQQHAEP
jgi:hypothetical protein